MKKTRNCLYLYADGHAVECFEKEDNDAGTVEFVEITEQYAKPGACCFKGRLIFSRYGGQLLAEIIRQVDYIHAQAPAVENGSENTRAAGIAVGGISLESKKGSLHIATFPGMIGGPFVYQPDCGENFSDVAEKRIWAGQRVARVHRVKGAEVLA